MNRAEMIMPGVIRITSDGPASTEDVDAWALEMYREIGLSPDDAERGADRSIYLGGWRE